MKFWLLDEPKQIDRIGYLYTYFYVFLPRKARKCFGKYIRALPAFGALPCGAGNALFSSFGLESGAPVALN